MKTDRIENPWGSAPRTARDKHGRHELIPFCAMAFRPRTSIGGCHQHRYSIPTEMVSTSPSKMNRSWGYADAQTTASTTGASDRKICSAGRQTTHPTG